MLGWNFLEKNITRFEISKLKFEKICFKKTLKPGTKIVSFGCLRAEFEKKMLSYLKSAPLSFSMCKVSCNTQKTKFDPKVVLFGYFWAAILSNCFHIWNQHPTICGIAKFHPKWKGFKLKTKNDFSGYFCARIWKTLLLYLKSTPLNFSKCKGSCKEKKIGGQNKKKLKKY